MSINQRIKEIRIGAGLNIVEFAARLDVTKSTTSRLEQEGYNVTPRNIQLICTNFNVSEEWLRYGTGEKYIENTESILQQLGKEYSLDSDTVTLVRSIVEATPEQRQSIVNFVETTAEKLRNARIKEAELKKQAETLNHDRPAGLSDDEWELVKNVRLEKSTATSSAFRSGKEA